MILPETLETDRLTLRPWRLTDVDAVLAYAQDDEWSRYLRLLPRPYHRIHAEQFVARQLLLDKVAHPSWAITLEGTPIGGINLRINAAQRGAEVGYSVARIHWGQGYCPEATRSVVDAAFETLPELVRFCARADARNVASQRVMEKVGMTREGVLRQSRVESGEIFDEVWFSILRTEWEAE